MHEPSPWVSKTKRRNRKELSGSLWMLFLLVWLREIKKKKEAIGEGERRFWESEIESRERKKKRGLTILVEIERKNKDLRRENIESVEKWWDFWALLREKEDTFWVFVGENSEEKHKSRIIKLHPLNGIIVNDFSWNMIWMNDVFFCIYVSLCMNMVCMDYLP